MAPVVTPARPSPDGLVTRRRCGFQLAWQSPYEGAMDSFDLLIIGGGINGAAIARDAAGRGARVLLVEKDDLAAHTSSASSKLIHGGLRYLEQYEFRLVRESLHEREIMLRTAPHIVRPLEFVLPDPPGGRPWWMIRARPAALRSARRPRQPAALARRRAASDAVVGAPLKPGFKLATYWDAWVDDARLVVAERARRRRARRRDRDPHRIARRPPRRRALDRATCPAAAASRRGMIVNAAGPWVAEVLEQRLGIGQPKRRAPGQGQPHRRAAAVARATMPISCSSPTAASSSPCPMASTA